MILVSMNHYIKEFDQDVDDHTTDIEYETKPEDWQS